jgi:putative ATPase
LSSDLFSFAEKNHPREGSQKSRPLAFRMRPKQLGEFFGQEEVLGQGKPLRKWIEAGRIPSLIFWGPPGCGKTTLAHILSTHLKADFITMSAVLSGTKELREVIERAKQVKRMSNQDTLLFLDEIHRFNKSQQDALLPHVEDGTVTFIGATTENPSFEINSALLSRVRVIRLGRLSIAAIAQALERAMKDPIEGLGGLIRLTPEAIQWLANSADGDMRRALTSLEIIHRFFQRSEQALEIDQVIRALESALEKQPIQYDKSGEEHYNIISAFIKSIRDSDPHAGLYYLARMLEGGEDPLFIVRRLVILASEDIGNADPRALTLAISVKEAVEFVGMPEARISLAQAVTYLAMAPKSNASYMGIEAAKEEVLKSGALPVPFHLRNARSSLMKSEGYGKNYRYAHSDPNARAKQTHLPDPLLGKRFYLPKEVGLEKQLKEKLDFLNSDFE